MGSPIVMVIPGPLPKVEDKFNQKVFSFDPLQVK